MPEGKNFVHSDSLGMVVTRVGQIMELLSVVMESSESMRIESTKGEEKTKRDARPTARTPLLGQQTCITHDMGHSRYNALTKPYTLLLLLLGCLLPWFLGCLVACLLRPLLTRLRGY